MKLFRMSAIILPSILLIACSQSGQDDSRVDMSSEYEGVGDLGELPPMQGVEMRKYSAEVDDSCNTNILCNIENAYSHYDAMNKDLQKSRYYQPVHNQNVNGIFALECGNDVIRNIARYRIVNELRIDVVTRDGEHIWCKGDYNLISFLRGIRAEDLEYIAN